MNLTSYKTRRLRQKPNILTIEQSGELGQLAGIKCTKNVADKGLIPINLFRLRKRKLEAIYQYLFSHQLIHDKEPAIESLQTHQLAEYLLKTIYPGYPACKAKNLAYTDYRECREKEPGQLNPLAYDYVPTTEVYDRLDEVYRIDVDWQEKLYTSTSSVDFSISALKKSIDRIRLAHNDKPAEGIEYHLCFWNSTLTLLKPQCKSLRLNSEEIWSDKKQKMVVEGFMHIDITEELKSFIAPSYRKSNSIQNSTINSNSHCTIDSNDTNGQQVSQQPIKEVTSKSKTENHVSPKANQKPVPIAIPGNITTNTQLSTSKSVSETVQQAPPEAPRTIRLELELFDNDEYNISHISISAVRKKAKHELVCELYLQATTECIGRAIRKSLFPLDTQQIVIHLLKQYHQADDGPEQKLRNAETVFMTCLSNTLFSDSSSEIRTTTSSEEEFDDDEFHDTVTLIDSVSHERIQHPIKSLHCRHRTCFDAASFFSQHTDIKLWHCPICLVHIKSFEELRVDYTTKVALNQYPHEDKLYVFGGDTLLSEAELFGEANRIMDGLDTNSLVIHIERENADPLEKTTGKLRRTRDQSEREEEEGEEDEEENHVQKRYRVITHVM